MTTRRPLVIQDGLVSELFPGDQAIAGYSPTEIVAGSGLGGGGSVSSDPSIYFKLPPNPSGLIISSGGLGTDGVALVNSNIAAASGSASVVYAQTALASGNAALQTAVTALASGNAALVRVPTLGVGEGTQALLSTASAVASGQPVGFDDTGRVQVVRRTTTTTSNPMTFGPRNTFTAFNTTFVATAVNTNLDSNEVLHTYLNAATSNYPTAVLGNIINSSGVYGSPIVLESFNSGANPTSCVYSPDANRYIVLYQWFDGGATYYLRSLSISASGNQIFAGSVATLATSSSSYIQSDITYDSAVKKPFYFYRNPSTSVGTVRLGTLTGNSITLGTATSLGVATYYISCAYTKDNKTVVSYYWDADTYGYSQVVTSSGDTLTASTQTAFRSAYVIGTATTYDPLADRVAVSFADYSLTKGSTAVGVISGSTISFPGSITTFAPSGIAVGNVRSTYDSSAGKVIITAVDGGYTQATAYVGTVSGNSISFTGTPSIYSSGNAQTPSVAYSKGTNRCIFAYRDLSLSNYGVSHVATPIENYTYIPSQSGTPNFVGVAQNSAASGSTCLINLPGSLAPIPSNNLAPGYYYYVDPSTSGFTTSSERPSTWRGAVPWTYVGKSASTSGMYLLRSV